MFKWLLRRRTHKIAVESENERRFLQSIEPLHLDREDHYTCVKCGHTHIVMKGE